MVACLQNLKLSDSNTGSYESVEGKIHYNTKRLIINYLGLKLV